VKNTSHLSYFVADAVSILHLKLFTFCRQREDILVVKTGERKLRLKLDSLDCFKTFCFSAARFLCILITLLIACISQTQI